MKAIRKKSKLAALLLTLLFLNQSCRVYHKDSSTLDQAVKEQKRVKIITKSNEKYKFKKVELIDNTFYGIKTKDGEQIKTPLRMDELKEVRLHNKTTSIIFTVLVSAGVVGLIYLISIGSGSLVGDIPLDITF